MITCYEYGIIIIIIVVVVVVVNEPKTEKVIELYYTRINLKTSKNTDNCHNFTYGVQESIGFEFQTWGAHLENSIAINDYSVIRKLRCGIVSFTRSYSRLEPHEGHATYRSLFFFFIVFIIYFLMFFSTLVLHMVKK